MQAMRDKKPSIDVFAKTLDLTDVQRQDVEREVLRAQHDIAGILQVPMADGTQALEELVEVMADSLARPGKDPGRATRLFGRLMAENVPGSNETYAARVEAVKAELRASFRRNWTAKQYATFEAWQMDPTEVKGIENSPWKGLEARVIERARALGAKLPETAGR